MVRRGKREKIRGVEKLYSKIEKIIKKNKMYKNNCILWDTFSTPRKSPTFPPHTILVWDY